MCAARVSRRGRGSDEVAVAQAVGVAFEGEDLGVVDEAVDHRRAAVTSSPKISPQPLKGLLEVTISDAGS